MMGSLKLLKMIAILIYLMNKNTFASTARQEANSYCLINTS